jgi:hypothetical protein
MLHDYIHLWQQIGRGKDPYKWEKHRKETHNKEWHQKTKELGLHPEGPAGVHIRPARVGSPIDILLKKMEFTRRRQHMRRHTTIKRIGLITLSLKTRKNPKADQPFTNGFVLIADSM